MPSWKKACFWLLVAVGSTVVLAWAVFTRVDPRNPDTWRAIGSVILSVEGLIVTWCWPRLFPIRRPHRSRHRPHRDHNRHRDEIIQLAMSSVFVSSLGGVDDKRRRMSSFARELSRSWSDGERSKSSISDGVRPLTKRSDCGEGIGSGGHPGKSPSTWGALASSVKVLLTHHSHLTIEQRRARTGWMQRFFLVLFTLSAICTTSQVVFPGKMIPVPVSGDPSDERIAAIGGNASPGERGITPASIKSDEVNSIGREDSSRKKKDKSTQNTMGKLLKIGNNPEGPKNGAADKEAAKADAKATIAAEEAAKGERGNTSVSIESDEVNSIRREDASRKKEDKSTQNTTRKLLKTGNKQEGPKNGAAGKEAAKAAAKATIAAEEAAKSVAAVAEEAAKSVAAAAEEAAKAIAAASAADANTAVKVDRKQISLINDKEAGEVATTSQASHNFLKRTMIRRWRVALATRAMTPENTSRQQMGEDERRLEEQTPAGKQDAVPETAVLHEGELLGVERLLINGPTKMWIMGTGDAVLFFNDVLVWEARGSKKRRTVLSRVWRKIRHRAPPSQCSKCRLTVTSSGRLEIREKGKLLWSDGKPKKKKKRTKNKKRHVSEDAEKPEPSEGDGDLGSSTYRLEVTDDGNAVLKRGDSEVVWQALDK